MQRKEKQMVTIMVSIIAAMTYIAHGKDATETAMSWKAISVKKPNVRVLTNAALNFRRHPLITHLQPHIKALPTPVWFYQIE